MSDAVAGVRLLAEVIERGLETIEADEVQMMVKRQDVEDLRGVLAQNEQLRAALDDARNYVAEVACGVAHYHHGDEPGCVRCERDEERARIAAALSISDLDHSQIINGHLMCFSDEVHDALLGENDEWRGEDAEQPVERHRP